MKLTPLQVAGRFFLAVVLLATPFLVAAVPASVALTLTGTQSVIGLKTFTDQLTASRTAVASSGEQIVNFSVSDVTSATNKIEFANSSAANATFVPRITGIGTTTLPGLSLEAVLDDDMGSEPAIKINTRVGTNTTVTTRPAIFHLVNGTTTVRMQISGAGQLKMSSSSTFPGIRMSNVAASTFSEVVGGIYLNTAGGPGSTPYVKESGTLTTGWVAK